MPLESDRPSTFMASMLMPCARLMAGLAPVARMALPCSVPKYQYSSAMSTAASSSPFQIALGTLRSVRNRSYLSGLTGVLAFMLMMRRLIE